MPALGALGNLEARADPGVVAVDTAPALRQISAVAQFLFRRPELTESLSRVAELGVGVPAGMASLAGAIRCIEIFSSWSTLERHRAGEVGVGAEGSQKRRLKVGIARNKMARGPRVRSTRGGGPPGRLLGCVKSAAAEDKDRGGGGTAPV